MYAGVARVPPELEGLAQVVDWRQVLFSKDVAEVAAAAATGAARARRVLAAKRVAARAELQM